MAQKTNPNWKKNYGLYLLLIALLLLSSLIILPVCCSQIRDYANQDIYSPTSNDSIIGKADNLLTQLLNEGHDNIKATSLRELNRKYPALTFAVATGDEKLAYMSDLRLVAVNVDSIKNECDRKFFINSCLPELLEKQSQKVGERMFKIIGNNNDKGIVIQKICLQPSMFKIALSPDPWTGVVMAQENSLFSEQNHCFLSWGQYVVPIQNRPNGNDFIVTANLKTEKLSYQKNNRNSDTEFDLTQWYEMSNAYKDGKTTLVMNIKKDKDYIGALRIRYVGNQVGVNITGKLKCDVYSEGKKWPVLPRETGTDFTNVDFSKNLKLMLRESSGPKLSEISITKHNPSLVLSKLVNSSAGNQRYTISRHMTDRFTQQVVKGISSTLTNNIYKDTVHLSLDPLLSMTMEKELKDYCQKLNKMGTVNNSKTRGWELSMTVIDMATGNVLAMPYYRSEDDKMDYDLTISRKNPALMRRYIGSTFKPLLALASVLTVPSLLNLDTSNGTYYSRSDDSKSYFLGGKTDTWASRRQWSGNNNMAEFLAYSNDVYPVALAALAFNGKSEPTVSNTDVFSTSGPMRFQSNPKFDIYRNRFAANIINLYDIKSDTEEYNDSTDDMNMSYYIWENLWANNNNKAELDKFGLDIVSPNVTVMRYNTFYDNPIKATLVPWVLGQGNNEWSCLKLGEAWSRMLTKRRIKASLVQGGQKDISLIHYDNKRYDKWSGFLSELEKAQTISGGTLFPMYQAVCELNKNENRNLVLFSKTGTPDNYERREFPQLKKWNRYLDIGLYCFGLMTSESVKKVLKENKPGKGIMCVVRITRIVEGDPKGNGISSSESRDFFSKSPERLQKFYRMTQKYY